ncbi:MAG TPA: FAD-dependent oxidoreductase, partial [Candidatus Paceibacterota bacterium]
EVKGDMFVKALVIKDVTTGAMTELPVAAVFVEVGMMSNTGWTNGIVALDEIGRVKVDGKTQRASVEGVWAAGDCSDGPYHQNNIAAGDAVKALEDIYFWVKKQAPTAAATVAPAAVSVHP